jgi:hypothetical protein
VEHCRATLSIIFISNCRCKFGARRYPQNGFSHINGSGDKLRVEPFERIERGRVRNFSYVSFLQRYCSFPTTNLNGPQNPKYLAKLGQTVPNGLFLVDVGGKADRAFLVRYNEKQRRRYNYEADRK